MYKDGKGTEQNYEKARECFEKTDNVFGLGELYFYGHGVTQDYEKAYEKSLNAEIDSMYLLGRDLSGYEETKEWYEAAAEKGDSDAQY